METRLVEQSNYIQTLEEQISESTEEMQKMKVLFQDFEKIIKDKDDTIEDMTSKLQNTGQLDQCSPKHVFEKCQKYSSQFRLLNGYLNVYSERSNA